MKKSISAVIMILGCLLAVTTQADCRQDSGGSVYCSQFPNGGAELDRIGSVLCGKGQCRTDDNGSVKCSRVEGGGAAVDNLGIVKCLGGCERGSRSMCVRGES